MMRINKIVLFISTVFLMAPLFAVTGNTTGNLLQQQENRLLQQEERLKERERALQGEIPDIHLQTPTLPTTSISETEQDFCLEINDIEISGIDLLKYNVSFQDLTSAVQGTCLGEAQITALMVAIQNRLIEKGYITTRIVAPEQDLTTSHLQLHIIEGTLDTIVLQQPQYLQPGNAFMLRKGQLLNLRDIEQGLENLKRVPTVDAQMSLLPGDSLGSSRIMITREQQKPWRVNLSFDDAGSKSTGRYQGALTLFLDNPLGLSDLFYVSLGRDTHNDAYYGSKNYAIHYSLPFGYWLLSGNYSKSHYRQTVAGPIIDPVYRGESHNGHWQVSRVIQRNEHQKTTFNYSVLTRQSRNYIDDAEVEVQRRQTSAWRAGIDHRYFITQGVFDFSLFYQQGVRWFNALPASEELFDEGTARSKILNWQASFNKTFALGEETFHYRGLYRHQYNINQLTQPDRLSIGGRWSVRGFDGELSLSGDRGWYIQNTLTWRDIIQNHHLYMGVDYGEVGGNEQVIGRRLVGGVIGVNGNLGAFAYDVFAGTPLSKPTYFRTSSAVLGFSVTWQY